MGGLERSSREENERSLERGRERGKINHRKDTDGTIEEGCLTDLRCLAALLRKSILLADFQQEETFFS